MLKLTPIEETRAGKELIQLGLERGREQGLEQGLEQGRLVGLQAGIQAVLAVRFPAVTATRLDRVLELLKHLQDDETVAMLLGLSQKVESLDLFENKISELVNRK